MEVKLLKIAKEQPEQVEVRCHEVTEEVREIVTFIKTRQGQLTGVQEGKQYEVPVMDICYIEAVDEKVFLYTLKQVYETRQRLLNLMKVQSIKPALNGRFTAVLKSGEEIIISRKYVPDLKRALKGGVF